MSEEIINNTATPQSGGGTETEVIDRPQVLVPDVGVGPLTPVIKVYSSEDDYPNNPKYIIQILNRYRFSNAFYPFTYTLVELKNDLLDEDKDKIDLTKQYHIYLSDFNVTRSRDLGVTTVITFDTTDSETPYCNPNCYWYTQPSIQEGAGCVTINLIDQTKKYVLDRNYITYADETLDPIFNYGPIPNENGEIDLSYYARNYIDDYMNITELPSENKEYLDEVLTTGKYKVTNMDHMFYYCYSLDTLDVSRWDTSNVTNMSSMFGDCRFIQPDVSNWDTSKVTDMNSMFASCTRAFYSLDVSNWDTSNVTDMSYMFYWCAFLQTITGTIDLTSCTNYSYMFDGAGNLISINIKLPSTITQSDFISGSGVNRNKTAVHFVS